MAPKSYTLNLEPGEELESKRILNSSPSATQVKILDQFSADGSGNMIEYRRMQMTLNKQKDEIQRLKQEKKGSDALICVTEQLKREVASLQAQLQEARTGYHSQIMELEDKVADLLATNRQLRAEIALNESTDVSEVVQVVLPKKTILPSRWTRSQPDLKATTKPRAHPQDLSVSEDTIDMLTSEVSQLALAKPMDQHFAPSEDVGMISPNLSEITPHTISLLQSVEPETIKEPAAQAPYTSLDVRMLAPVPPSITGKSIPRESRFTENFSLDDALSSIVEEPAESKGTQEIPKQVDFAVKNPTPTFESTFIGDLPQIPAKPASEKPKLHISKAFKSHPNIKMAMISEKPKQVSGSISNGANIYQMVSQVFLGEMLHKSTRGFRKLEMHPRYFWVHPYTLTLYWGKEGPSKGATGKAPKSLAILGVSEEANLNPCSNLFHKTIIISSGKRDVKITCADSTQHDVWMRSLQHLLAGTEAK